MKTSISNALQVISAIVITGSMAYAMATPAPTTQFNAEAPAQTQTEQTEQVAPATPTEPPQQAQAQEQPVTQPEPVTAPVEPPVQQQSTRIAADLSAGQQSWLLNAGIPQNFWRAVEYINTKESQWCPTRWQGYHGPCLDYYEEAYPGAESDTSKGYGLCQSTPANKMAAAGADWRTNPVTQLKWCQMHADSHHGGWGNAYAYHLANGNW